jgi:ech hydrogenase subunit D
MTERKDLIQEFVRVPASELLETVSDIKTEGYRLGQICATTTDENIEVLYSFEKDTLLKNLKVEVPLRDAELHSITAVYWPAFIYENEMHDLFGITFRNLALDFGGHFLKIAKKTPWNPQARDGVAEDARDKSTEIEEFPEPETDQKLPAQQTESQQEKSPAAPESEGGEE